MKLPREVRAELEATGLPWSLEPGTRHLHVRVGGRLAGILPKGRVPCADRATQNIISQIRRVARQLKQETTHAHAIA